MCPAHCESGKASREFKCKAIEAVIVDKPV